MSKPQSQLQAIDTQSVVGSFTQSELDTLKATIARGTTNEQFALFVQTCVSSGLNPFLNQIFCQVYNGKDGPVMSIQIAVEGIVSLAKRHPNYKGFIASEVKELDEFEIDVVSGEPVHRIKTMIRGKTIGSYCVAYREGAPNICVVVTIDQVEHLQKSDKGAQARMWKDYLDDMIVKHAIKRAFKRQFGIEVAEDEPVHDNGVPAYQPERRDITNEASHSTPEQSKQPDPAPSAANDEAERKRLKAECRKHFVALNLTESEDREKFFTESGIKFKDPENPTAAEYKRLLKVLEMKVAEKQTEQDELPM